MFNFWSKKSKGESQDVGNEIEITLTDANGNPTGKRRLSRQEQIDYGYINPDEQAGDGMVEVPIFDTTGRPAGTKRVKPAEALKMYGETNQPSQTPEAASSPETEPSPTPEEIVQIAATETLNAGIHEPALMPESKLNLTDPRVPGTLRAQADQSKSFGQKSKDAIASFLLGTGTGTAIAYKVVAGTAVRAGIKHALNLAALGAGTAAGAVAGGAWEGIRAFRKEGTRIEQERQRCRELLESISNQNERADELLKIRTSQDMENLSPEQKAVVKQYHALKRDKQKIAAATLKGAAIGGLGGLLGGALVEIASYGIQHFLDHGTAAAAEAARHALHQAAESAHHAPLQTHTYPSFRGDDVTQHMHDNTWNTVKDWYHAHGIARPSNELINEGTRKLAELNNIDITEDHLAAAAQAVHHHVAGGISDVAMQQGHELHHMEALNSLIEGAGGTPEHLTQVITAPGVDVPDVVEHVSGGTAEVLAKTEFIALAGIAAAGAATLYLRNRKKKQREVAEQRGEHETEDTEEAVVAPAQEAKAELANQTGDAETQGTQQPREQIFANAEQIERVTNAHNLVRMFANRARKALENGGSSAATALHNATQTYNNIRVKDIADAGLRPEHDALRRELDELSYQISAAEAERQATRRFVEPPQPKDNGEKVEPEADHRPEIRDRVQKSLATVQNHIDEIRNALKGRELERARQQLQEAQQAFKEITMVDVATAHMNDEHSEVGQDLAVLDRRVSSAKKASQTPARAPEVTVPEPMSP